MDIASRLLSLCLVFLACLPMICAQSGTSSALSGSVVDPSGAAIAGATVTSTEVDTKAVRVGSTDASGRYVFSQVSPGSYRVSVSSPGFGTSVSQPTAVGVGRTIALHFTLQVTSTSEAIEVTARQGLLSLDNPNTTTTLEEKTIKSLPNPGQDLTYVAQFAQGALMNTAGSSNDAKAAGDTAMWSSTDCRRRRTATSWTAMTRTILGWG